MSEDGDDDKDHVYDLNSIGSSSDDDSMEIELSVHKKERLRVLMNKLLNVDPLKKFRKYLLMRSFIRWSRVFPMFQKCDELFRQLQERMSLLESLRVSYLKDVICIKNAIEISKKSTVNKKNDEDYDLQAVPSANLRPIIDSVNQSPQLSSFQFREMLLAAGLFNVSTGDVYNPWEEGKAFQSYMKSQKGSSYKVPNVGGGALPLSRPSGHKLYIRRCQDCLGVLSLVASWNSTTEEALRLLNQSRRYDEHVVELKATLQSLNSIIASQQAEINMLESQKNEVMATNKWFDKWGFIKEAEAKQAELENKCSLLRARLALSIEDRNSALHSQRFNMDQYILEIKQSEERAKNKYFDALGQMNDSTQQSRLLQAKIDGYEHRLLERDKALKDIQVLLKFEKENNSALQSRVKFYCDRESELLNAIDVKEKKFQQLQLESSSQIEELKTQITTLSEEYSSKEELVDSLREKLRDLEEVSSRLKKTVKEKPIERTSRDTYVVPYKKPVRPVRERPNMFRVAIWMVRLCIRIMKGIRHQQYGNLGVLKYRVMNRSLQEKAEQIEAKLSLLELESIQAQQRYQALSDLNTQIKSQLYVTEQALLDSKEKISNMQLEAREMSESIADLEKSCDQIGQSDVVIGDLLFRVRRLWVYVQLQRNLAHQAMEVLFMIRKIVFATNPDCTLLLDLNDVGKADNRSTDVINLIKNITSRSSMEERRSIGSMSSRGSAKDVQEGGDSGEEDNNDTGPNNKTTTTNTTGNPDANLNSSSANNMKAVGDKMVDVATLLGNGVVAPKNPERTHKLMTIWKKFNQQMLLWIKSSQRNRTLHAFTVEKFKSRFLRPKKRDPLAPNSIYATSVLECEILPRDFVDGFRKDCERIRNLGSLAVNDVRRLEDMASNLRAELMKGRSFIQEQDHKIVSLEKKVQRLKIKAKVSELKCEELEKQLQYQIKLLQDQEEELHRKSSQPKVIVVKQKENKLKRRTMLLRLFNKSTKQEGKEGEDAMVQDKMDAENMEEKKVSSLLSLENLRRHDSMTSGEPNRDSTKNDTVLASEGIAMSGSIVPIKDSSIQIDVAAGPGSSLPMLLPSSTKDHIPMMNDKLNGKPPLLHDNVANSTTSVTSVNQTTGSHLLPPNESNIDGSSSSSTHPDYRHERKSSTSSIYSESSRVVLSLLNDNNAHHSNKRRISISQVKPDQILSSDDRASRRSIVSNPVDILDNVEQFLEGDGMIEIIEDEDMEEFEGDEEDEDDEELKFIEKEFQGLTSKIHFLEIKTEESKTIELELSRNVESLTLELAQSRQRENELREEHEKTTDELNDCKREIDRLIHQNMLLRESVEDSYRTNARDKEKFLRETYQTQQREEFERLSKRKNRGTQVSCSVCAIRSFQHPGEFDFTTLDAIPIGHDSFSLDEESTPSGEWCKPIVNEPLTQALQGATVLVAKPRKINSFNYTSSRRLNESMKATESHNTSFDAVNEEETHQEFLGRNDITAMDALAYHIPMSTSTWASPIVNVTQSKNPTTSNDPNSLIHQVNSNPILNKVIRPQSAIQLRGSESAPLLSRLQQEASRHPSSRKYSTRTDMSMELDLDTMHGSTEVHYPDVAPTSKFRTLKNIPSQKSSSLRSDQLPRTLQKRSTVNTAAYLQRKLVEENQ